MSRNYPLLGASKRLLPKSMVPDWAKSLAAGTVLVGIIMAVVSCGAAETTATGVDDSPVLSSPTSDPSSTAHQAPAATTTPPPNEPPSDEPRSDELKATTVPGTTPEPVPTSAPAATPEPTPEPSPEPVPPPASTCTTLAAFDLDETNAEWIVVNDNVMGGQSLGDRSFTQETMVFAGAINTNGGGFSSLRLPLPAGALTQADRVQLRARSDGRSYMLTFDDSLEGRNRRVSFRAPLNFATIGEWETVTVEFDDLWPAIFGQRVEADPFRPDLATRIGIMLSDGIDGEFSLEVDDIQACS